MGTSSVQMTLTRRERRPALVLRPLDLSLQIDPDTRGREKTWVTDTLPTYFA